jgi:hypothetical protein
MTQSSRGTATSVSTDSAPSVVTSSCSAALAADAAQPVAMATRQIDAVAGFGETSVRQTEGSTATIVPEQKSSRLRWTLRWVSTHRREAAAAVLALIMLGVFADEQSHKSGSGNADQTDELREVEELLADFGTETSSFNMPGTAASPETVASNEDHAPAGSPLNDGNALTIPITPGAGTQGSGPTTDAPAPGSDTGSRPRIAGSESVAVDGPGTLNISTADYAAGSGTSSSQPSADQQSITNSTSVDGASSGSVPSASPSGPRNRVSQIRFRGEIRPIRQ